MNLNSQFLEGGRLGPPVGVSQAETIVLVGLSSFLELRSLF